MVLNNGSTKQLVSELKKRDQYWDELIVATAAGFFYKSRDILQRGLYGGRQYAAKAIHKINDNAGFAVVVGLGISTAGLKYSSATKEGEYKTCWKKCYDWSDTNGYSYHYCIDVQNDSIKKDARCTVSHRDTFEEMFKNTLNRETDLNAVASCEKITQNGACKPFNLRPASPNSFNDIEPIFASALLLLNNRLFICHFH